LAFSAVSGILAGGPGHIWLHWFPPTPPPGPHLAEQNSGIEKLPRKHFLVTWGKMEKIHSLGQAPECPL
jgi:hypothetical protein